MDINSFTLKSQEVLSRAEEDALAQGHISIETLHVLGAMMSVEDPVIPILLGRINVPVKRIQQAVSAALQRLGTAEDNCPQWSRDAGQVLQRAVALARKAGDEYVATDRLVQALLQNGDSTSQILKDAGVTQKGWAKRSSCSVRAKPPPRPARKTPTRPSPNTRAT